MICAYFTYRVLFRMDFFPFISLLAVVLLLGIGADDAFILRQSWRKARNTASATPVVRLVECALERSFATMAVTSATTICALLANTVSHITAVKCFGVFAALCILFNFILILTWLPACLLYQHNRYLVRFICRLSIALLYHFISLIAMLIRTFCVTVEATFRCAWRILEKIRLKMPFENGYKQRFYAVIASILRIFIVRLKFLTIFVFAFLFILSLYVLLINPGVNLPSKDYFQYFRNGHIIEQYDAFYKHRFKHAKSVSVLSLQKHQPYKNKYVLLINPGVNLPSKDYFQYFRNGHIIEQYDAFYKHRFKHAKSKTIPLIFQLAYGFDPLHSSHYFKPQITEKLEIWPRDEFELDNIDSLQELNRICEHISTSEFITSLPRDIFHPSACFVDKILAYMGRPCSLTLMDCCVEANISRHIGNVSSCLSKMYSEYEFLLTQPADLNLPFGRALFVDDLESDRRYGIHIIAFLTNYTFTFDYAKMKRYYQIFESLMNDVLKNTSSFFRKGFFLTEAFQFYDLQHSLLYETLISALISIAIAFLILFIVIRDLLVCFISVLSIIDVMVTTGAILVNLLLHKFICDESAADLSGRHCRIGAVRSINEVICPVTMSMLTTFVTGLGMVFADTLCFLQMSRLPNEIISGSRRTSKISRNGENLYDKCLLSTSSFEQCSSRFPVLEQYDGRLLRCSRTGIHSKRSSGQLYYGDIRRASMPVAFTAFVNRCEFTWESALVCLLNVVPRH
uniref:SSD domain-containing protein n=1 Tax=Ascaris lumbricoides TaxID=6252 RepID=A0A0M3IMW8_ASCLU